MQTPYIVAFQWILTSLIGVSLYTLSRESTIIVIFPLSKGIKI